MRLPPLPRPNIWRTTLTLGCGVQAIVSGSAVGAQALIAERKSHLGLSSTLETDSNVLRLADADLSAQHRSDVHWAPVVTLDYERPVGRQDVYLLGTLGYNVHARNPQLNTSAFNLQAGVDVRAGHSCAARFGGVFVRQLANLSDVNASGIGYTVQSTTAYIARVNCARGSGLHPTLGYRHEAVRNSAALLQTNDTFSDAFDASLGIQRASLGELSVYGNYRRGRYPHHPFTGPDAVRFYGAGVGFSRQIGARLRGNASFGYSQVVSSQPGVRPYHGASWTADVRFTPSSRSSVTVGLARDSQQSSLINISYTISTTAHARAEYALTHMIRVSLGAQAARRSFEGAATIDSVTGQSDRSVSLTAGLSYASPIHILRNRVTFAADMTYNRHSSDFAALRTHNLVAALSVRIGA